MKQKSGRSAVWKRWAFPGLRMKGNNVTSIRAASSGWQGLLAGFQQKNKDHGPTVTRNWIMSRMWMNLEAIWSPEPSGKKTAMLTHWLWLVKFWVADPLGPCCPQTSDLQNSAITNSCCSKPLAVICYASNKKLIQMLYSDLWDPIQAVPPNTPFIFG